VNVPTTQVRIRRYVVHVATTPK